MDAASLSDLLNVPHPGFAWKGKLYQFTDLTIGQRAEFRRWLIERAVLAAASAPEGAPGDFMDGFKSVVIQDAASGVYDWAGPACVKALTTRAGAVKVLTLAIGGCDPEFTESDAEELWDAEFKAVLKQVVERASADPLAYAGRPESSPAGPPSSPGSPTAST